MPARPAHGPDGPRRHPAPTPADSARPAPATAETAPADVPPAGPPDARPADRGRRHLALAVLAAAAGAGLALWAAGHGWTVRVTTRPAPLPPLRVARTGGTVLPWLPALGWVALAGAGAVPATRRLGRAVVAAVLLATGLGLLAGGGYGLALAGARVTWPLATAVGGLLVAGAGLVTLRRGSRWPAMGTRYERTAAPRTGGRASEAELWGALDRGEDPTAGD